MQDGVGITAERTLCPGVGVPDYTGDITLFRGESRTADAIDVTAALTNVRTSCNDTASDRIYVEASFDVYARRTDVRGERTVQLPYFATVLQAGRSVVSKEIGTVSVTFADGAERATGSARGGAFVDRAAVTLPDDIRDRITRRRRSGEAEAAVDPLTLPEVREALARADFELLIGFQLSEGQLAYNATR